MLPSLLALVVLAAPVAAPAAGPASEVAEAPAAAADVPADVLIRRCVEAYGGDRGLLRLARTRAEGTVTSALHPGELGKVIRTYDRPGRLRLEIRFGAGRPEVRILDGARSWRYGLEAQPAFTAALQVHAARLDLPALLSSGFSRVTERDGIVVEGQRLRVLAVEVSPEVTVEAALDPATGRILQARGVARTGPRELEFVTRFGDFRVLDGVLMPMRETSWANGEQTGEAVVQSVSFPEVLEDPIFQP
ncbi:MAG: hypothetical protein QM767_03555 [Anaeromyxobacter sp.]